MESVEARPAAEPTAQPLAPPPVPAQARLPHHCAAAGSAGYGSAARIPDSTQLQLCSPAAPQGTGNVSRRNAAAGAPLATGTPGTAPCTPETLSEAAAAADDLRHSTSGQAEQAHAAEASAAVEPAAASPGSSDSSHPTLRRLQSFVHCVAGSPIIQSALLYLEHKAEHPIALPASQAAAEQADRAAAASLEWTLAQMLALHLRAGYEHARESALLAALWVVESAHSAWRSPASICVSSYTKYVGAFSSELVRRLTADWPASFTQLKRALVQAQADLLQRTGWRVRLDLAADVLPCYAMLFCPALLDHPNVTLDNMAALAPPQAGAEQQEWAAVIRNLCAIICGKARRLKAHEQASSAARLPTLDCEAEADRPAKRHRASRRPV